mgnify:CR=1 FL=1
MISYMVEIGNCNLNLTPLWIVNTSIKTCLQPRNKLLKRRVCACIWKYNITYMVNQGRLIHKGKFLQLRSCSALEKIWFTLNSRLGKISLTIKWKSFEKTGVEYKRKSAQKMTWSAHRRCEVKCCFSICEQSYNDFFDTWPNLVVGDRCHL